MERDPKGETVVLTLMGMTIPMMIEGCPGETKGHSKDNGVVLGGVLGGDNNFCNPADLKDHRDEDRQYEDKTPWPRSLTFVDHPPISNPSLGGTSGHSTPEFPTLITLRQNWPQHQP